MRQISIYGAGHLTKSLIKGFSQTIPDRPITVYNRTVDKVAELQAYHTKINCVNNYHELNNVSSFVFLIIPASAIIDLDETFATTLLHTDSVVVSCANYLSIERLDLLLPKTKIIRLLPNINWQINQGTTIYKANSHISNNDLFELFDILGPITKLIEADSDLDFDSLGKLTSCGPGLISKIVDQLLISFDISNANHQQADYHTIKSTMNYLIDSGKSPNKVISEVANKGGLTESGIIAAQQTLSDCFDYISNSMNERLIERKQVINNY